MDNLEQITKVVSDLGIKPSDVVKYWQGRGLLAEQKNISFINSADKVASLDFRQRVKEILAHKACCRDTEITEYASLQRDLSIDSLDEVELIIQLEKDFKITILDEETLNVKTVADLIQLVANHV